uniref:C2 domain-containing protein n=1 Tax=Aegilops tauschii subsp. strangulata TaxID=200361 RepID=A0A453DHE3_AEGTS
RGRNKPFHFSFNNNRKTGQRICSLAPSWRKLIDSVEGFLDFTYTPLYTVVPWWVGEGDIHPDQERDPRLGRPAGGDREGGGDMVRGKLEVLLVSAKGLDDSDFFNSMDPYVILTCRSHEQKSTVASGIHMHLCIDRP